MKDLTDASSEISVSSSSPCRFCWRTRTFDVGVSIEAARVEVESSDHSGALSVIGLQIVQGSEVVEFGSDPIRGNSVRHLKRGLPVPIRQVRDMATE